MHCVGMSNSDPSITGISECQNSSEEVDVSGHQNLKLDLADF